MALTLYASERAKISGAYEPPDSPLKPNERLRHNRRFPESVKNSDNREIGALSTNFRLPGR